MADGVNVVLQIKELMDDVKSSDKLLTNIKNMIDEYFEENTNMGGLPIRKTQEDYDSIPRGKNWPGTDFTPKDYKDK